jgi:hypothetical protein
LGYSVSRINTIQTPEMECCRRNCWWGCRVYYQLAILVLGAEDERNIAVPVMDWFN